MFFRVGCGGVSRDPANVCIHYTLSHTHALCTSSNECGTVMPCEEFKVENAKHAGWQHTCGALGTLKDS